MTRFLHERTHGQGPRYDREGLAAWASERFHTVVDADELRPMLRPEIEALLLDVAHKHYPGGRLAEELERKVEAAYGPAPADGKVAPPPPDDTALADLAAWAREHLGVETTADELAALGRGDARNRLVNALDARHRPEMREMEKVLLLQILDSSWMEHLRAMDHLRSSIGLQGYAQIDPKVEYKREGMKIFAEMWAGVSDKVTDLIFRVEQFDPDFLAYLGARWQLDRAQTIHQSAPSELASAAAPARPAIRAQQEAAIAASQQTGEKKHEPVRNVGKKVGRNDPCPCGSGKKFKACCMRKEASSRPLLTRRDGRRSRRTASARSPSPSDRPVRLRSHDPTPDPVDSGPGSTPSVARRTAASRHAGCTATAGFDRPPSRVARDDDDPGKDSPMPSLLNLIYLALLVGLRPRAVYRAVRSGKYREGWSEKVLGQAPLRIGDRPCLWFHAVSVGEVLLLRPIVAELARRRPGWEVVVSTTTPTGLAVARRTFPDLVTFYAPLDFSLGDPAGRGAGPADGAGPGRAGALAEPGPRGEAGRGAGGDRQRPAQPPEPSRLSPAPGAARADAPPARRGRGADRGVRRAVRRPRRPPADGSA